MFTGIVQGIAVVREVARKPGLLSIGVELPNGKVKGLAIGGSVSIDGVCLTATRVEGDRVYFDLMAETLSRSTLNDLREGTRVNYERAATFGSEIGGHAVSGHVDGIGEIVAIEVPDNNYVVTVQAPPELRKFIFAKGYISVNGASLTIVASDRAEGCFALCLIPETLRLTTFADKKVGDRLNIEIDRTTQVIVETVERMLSAKRIAN